jgi:hypothetical protein
MSKIETPEDVEKFIQRFKNKFSHELLSSMCLHFVGLMKVIAMYEMENHLRGVELPIKVKHCCALAINMCMTLMSDSDEEVRVLDLFEGDCDISDEGWNRRYKKLIKVLHEEILKEETS